MFEGLRDRRPNRDQEAQDAAIAEAASKLARRRMQQAGQPHDTAGWTSPAKTTPSKAGAPHQATVTDQLGMVAQHVSAVDEPDKSESEEHDTQSVPEAGQTLTVGAGIHLKGEITNCQTLIVEGQVEGSAKSGVLQIADGGAFIGEAEIDTAVVSGRFEGTLTAAERLVIRASGRVSGDIRYAAIAIEAGGQISGNIQVTEGPVSEGKAISSESASQARTTTTNDRPQGGPDARVEIAS